MAPVDYNASAEVFAIRQTGPKRHMTHRRFSTTAEAVKFAVEELPPDARAVIEVDEDRFEGGTIRRMYDADDYPLARAEGRGQPGRSS